MGGTRDHKRSPFSMTTRYADSRVTQPDLESADKAQRGFNYAETVAKLDSFYRQGIWLLLAFIYSLNFLCIRVHSDART